MYEYATLSKLSLRRLESSRHVRVATYPYFQSSVDAYILSRDGVEVTRGTEGECWDYIHTTHCYSVEHALRYEGYTLTPLEMA